MSFVRSDISESSWFCSNTCFHSGHQQVANPIIPYVGPIISGGLKPGMALYVQGTVPDNANQFSINFQTGQNKYDDIAFYFNPWIGQYVYLNSFQNGNWEEKECVLDESFTRGVAFNMFIVTKTDGYEVYVNDLRRYMFQHRIPLEKVTTLCICGDVSIDFFGLCENWRRSSFREQAITSTESLLLNMLPIPSEVSHQVIHPILPHVGTIGDRLKPEMAVFFQGALPAHPKEFEINFQTGQSDSDDIAFHFNPRIGKHVYLNSFRNGSWEKEECVSDELFTKGAGFYMFVVISSEGYEVYVNGLQHCMFNHRVPLKNISTISIYGDVTISIYGFIDNWSKSFNFTDLLKITGMGSSFSSLLPILSEVSHPVILPALPYVGTIRGGIRSDTAVFFQGTLPAHAKMFAINFQTGQSDSDDIAFHFNPHIGKHVYLNSFRNASWEKEETAPDKLFTKGAAFNMFVIISSEGYEVYVNGVQLCIFKHRIPLESISTLAIFGDISVAIYGFIDNWSRSPLCMDRSNATGCRSSFSKQLSVPSEVSHPVIQPALPYMGTIKEEIRPDMAVLFHGTVSEHGKSFEINLLTGDSDNDDIAFHISPRIGKSMALNSFINGSWETEEYASDNPFSKGTSFNLFFVINSEGYEVYINSLQHCTFKHRIPLEKVSTLGIRGDVTINYFGFVENWSTSSMARKINEIPEKLSISGNLMHIPSEISHPVINPELPYVGSIPEGLRTDMAVFLKVALPADAKVFTINFQTGESDGDDIAFHINPRIGELVALNSFRNGSWETEEHASITPFAKEGALNMNIVINSEGYEVYVNGLQHCTFKHRIPLENVSTLGICGDVIINYFGFVENWSESSMAVEMNDIQDMSITSGSLIDVPSEISHPLSSPESAHVDTVPEALKTDKAVIFQVALPADANNAVNFKITHRGSENWNESSMVVESNEIQDMSLITGSLIDVPSEISHPISSPELPYVGAIPGGLKTDMAVIFQGNIPADAKEFKINFQTGESDGENIAFHINPRIGELVALNSFRNGSWETEEHASITPFAKEGALNMNIVINSEGYEVCVNGLQHCTFKHRIPLENVSTLGICGDVIINYFGFVENWSRSSLALENKQSTEMRSTSVTLLPITTDKLTLPFVGSIPGGIRADMAVLFYGTILADSNEFEINFQTCQSSDDIAFNINPQIVRFLVLSSLRNGEDLASDNGAAFNMFVVLKLEGYEVYVNGLQYCTFKHCIPLETISSLGIRGDVFINFIGFIDNWSSSSMVMENIKITGMERSCWRPIPIPSQVSHPVSNPALPYVGVIPGKARPDMAVLFQGALPADANEFTINFQTGESVGDDIAFHINPQLGHYVALNSFRNGSWETEESASDKPFTKGAAFNMFVVIKSEGYEVYVNGLELCTFKHRISLENISKLGICGDVSINFIGFIETWSKFSFIIENNEITGMQTSSWKGSSHQMISTSSEDF